MVLTRSGVRDNIDTPIDSRDTCRCCIQLFGSDGYPNGEGNYGRVGACGFESRPSNQRMPYRHNTAPLQTVIAPVDEMGAISVLTRGKRCGKV